MNSVCNQFLIALLVVLFLIAVLAPMEVSAQDDKGKAAMAKILALVKEKTGGKKD